MEVYSTFEYFFGTFIYRLLQNNECYFSLLQECAGYYRFLQVNTDYSGKLHSNLGYYMLLKVSYRLPNLTTVYYRLNISLTVTRGAPLKNNLFDHIASLPYHV